MARAVQRTTEDGEEESDWLVAIGGFHPRYKVSELLTQTAPVPKQDRAGFSAKKGIAKLTFESYLAFSANSIQFGARVQLVAKKSGFTAEAVLGLDVIFITEPCFHFVADIEARAAIKKGSRTLMGVDLRLGLSGPKPWNARGKATFKILFVKFTIGFDEEWGELCDEELPLIELENLLAGELGADHNWGGLLSLNGHEVVSFGEPREEETGVAVSHPLGSVEFRQRTLPLGLNLARVGRGLPASARRVEITGARIGGHAASVHAVHDQFAPGQYLDMTEEEKLTRPSFERFTSGFAVSASGGVTAPVGVSRTVEYRNDRAVPVGPKAAWHARDGVCVGRAGCPLCEGRLRALHERGTAAPRSFRGDRSRCGPIRRRWRGRLAAGRCGAAGVLRGREAASPLAWPPRAGGGTPRGGVVSLARYQFLPWLRRGAAAAIDTPDRPGAALTSRASFVVQVDVNNRAAAEKTVRLRGPGDIAGLERRQIVRTDPVAGATDFEPNYFPSVELDEASLPWLFTPASADSGTERLRPWLVLVVVEHRDGVTIRASRDRPLPLLTITAPAHPREELPDLAESWWWAHAQAVVPADGSVTDVLNGDPRLSLSRLICPRQLQPSRRYQACLVPAFSAGVKAGRGESVSEGEPLEPAWRSDDGAAGSIELPVYFTGSSPRGRSATSNHWPAGSKVVRCRRASASGRCISVTRA